MSDRWACLIGQPVEHSLSPRLHNGAFRALGIDARYELRDVSAAQLAEVVEALRSPDCLGANVTAPHKQAVLPLLDQVSDAARELGAVNTIVNSSGRLLGDNTDAAGLTRWLTQASIAVSGKRALVLGAGGAARATVWALAKLGAARIHVVNRTRARAEEVVRELCAERGSWGALHEASQPQAEPWDVVVNATSLGHHGHAPTLHPSCYSRDSVAIELAYNPPVTGFMQFAQDAGARTENGLGMLLYQAALAFERWLGYPPPIEVYEASLMDRQTA